MLSLALTKKTNVIIHGLKISKSLYSTKHSDQIVSLLKERFSSYTCNTYLRTYSSIASVPWLTSGSTEKSIDKPLNLSLPKLAKCHNLPSTRKFNTRVMPVKVTENDIISSEEDKRHYRGLVLENDLKVLLISDPVTDKSAAALDVHVGSMSDPWELPGLAHFCEHMLFMGTEKYPCENDYSKYLSEHNGGSNAYTASDHTNYFFDVSPDAFKGALDRFAQFFLTPLFTESGVEREVKAVHSEHEKNLQNDYWRLSQLEKATSDPNHDFSKFGTGSLETLGKIPKEKGINVRDALLDFHKKYYSANIMSLSVLGKESLDELEGMVVSMFSGIVNKNVEVPEWESHPFGEEQCKKMIYVNPVKDIRKLNITFPIPDLRMHYKTSPGHYLGHLIGHEGPGSLLSCLKAQGWVNSIVAGQSSGARGFGFFLINVDLTEEGILHVEDIVRSVFQFLNLLKKEGPQRWVFDECSNINAMTFRFKDKEIPQSYVSSVSTQLHYFPLREVLSGDFLLSEYKDDLITSVLDCLTLDKIRVTVVGKAVAKETDSKEPWYETEYKIADLSDVLRGACSCSTLNEELKMPPRNEFIATDFALVNSDKPLPEVPTLISESPLVRVWYKQDAEFKLPKSVIYVEFFSRIAYLDPLHTNLLHMFVQLFRDALTEYSYAAELAGLHYVLLNTKYGLTLNVSGYSDKQDILLEKVIDKMTSFEIDPKRFDIIKELHVRTLKNFASDQPHQHLVYYTSLLLSEIGWTKEELLEATEELTVDKLESFIPRFLASLHLEFLIHGNVSQTKAEKLADVVLSRIQSQGRTKPLLASQFVRHREMQLPLGCSFVYNAENSVHKSSAVETLFQFGQMDTRENVMAELLVQVLKEPCFDVLRTKEQLGYIVFCGLRRSNGTQGVRIIVQGERSPEYLDERIEAFLCQAKCALLEMSDEQFLCHREALSKRRLERPKKLRDLTSRWWGEVTSNQYHFDRDRDEVQSLSTVTKDELIAFFNQFIDYESLSRKKLSVQVISVAPGGAGDATTNNHEDQDDLQKPPVLKKPEPISSIPEFKCSLPLFPLKKPHIPLCLDAKAKL